jgi:hypothetical protein
MCGGTFLCRYRNVVVPIFVGTVMCDGAFLCRYRNVAVPFFVGTVMWWCLSL